MASDNTRAAAIANRVAVLLNDQQRTAAVVALLDYFIGRRASRDAPAGFVPGISPSGRPVVMMTQGMCSVSVIIHGSVMPTLEHELSRGSSYTQTVREYYVGPPALRRSVVEYWYAAAKAYLTAHPNISDVLRSNPLRVQLGIATLPWTEQGSRPAICWNAVGLSNYGNGTWCWLNRAVSQYGYGFIACGRAYTSREDGQREYLRIVTTSNTYSMLRNPLLTDRDAVAKFLTMWKRGVTTPDYKLYDDAVAAAVGVTL